MIDLLAKRRIYDYLYIFFGGGVSTGIAFVNSIIIARTIGPAKFGLFSLFYVVMILIWQLPMAFDTTYIRYAKTSSCSLEKNDFLKTALLLKLFYAAIVICISYPLSYLLANYCFHKPETHSILLASMISGIFLSFLKTIASIFQEKEKFFKFTMLNTFYAFSILCSLLLLKALKYEFSLRIVVLIYLIVSFIFGVISIVLLFRKLGNIFLFKTHALKKSFSLGKWIFGVTVVYFIFQRLDILFLTRYFNSESIGIYFVGSQLVMIISLAIGSLSGVSLPRACAAIESKGSFKVFVRESLLVVAVINICIVGLLVISPFLIKMLYGNEYILASSILRILLIGWAFAAAYTPFSFLYYAYDDSSTRFFLEFSKIAIAVIALYMLIPKYGLTGGAIAISITLTANAIISIIVLVINKKYKYKGAII